jgi:hypothetical protein
VILAAQEAEIRRTVVRSQPREIVPRDPISKKNPSQKRVGGVAQGVGPEFKHQYHKTHTQTHTHTHTLLAHELLNSNNSYCVLRSELVFAVCLPMVLGYR